MEEKEFKHLINSVREARNAIEYLRALRGKYPAGVAGMLTKKQFASMEKAERELNAAIDQTGQGD